MTDAESRVSGPSGVELNRISSASDGPRSESVDVWITDPTHVALADLEPLVVESEREREASFVFEKNRREYLVTRALVREVLSRYRPVAPRDWRFSRNRWGRPEIDPPCGLRFNVSNNPTMVVCAVAESRELGVDVEPVARGEAIVGLANTVFAPAELEDLHTLPEQRRPDRAVTLWTLKEAYIKARGMGFAIPLSGLAFRFEGGSVRIEFDERIDDRPARWTFIVRSIDDHRIALAVDGSSDPSVRVERWTPRRP